MPGFDMSRVLELKRRMVSETNIPEIVNYFLDEFATNSDFMEAQETVEWDRLPDVLKNAIYELMQRILGPKRYVIGISSFEVPGWNLLHGSLTIDNKHGLFLWAPDLNTGIVNLSIETEAGNNHTARFTLAWPEDKAKRWVN
ncbi:MAG: hypothetical protein FJW39_15335 [Acidobacteria bacterium]|nr:hypothetical protein [Acidobacteriota bacterium]